MAQDFRRSKAEAVGTGATLIYTAGASTHNCVVGIGLANILGSPINVSAFVTDAGGSFTNYLIKDAPVPTGSQLQVMDGGAKVVLQDGDQLKVISDTASSVDVWVSTVNQTS